MADEDEEVVSAIFSTGMDYEWKPRGHTQELLDKDLTYALKSGTHYWIALAMFKLSDQSIKSMMTEKVHMDMENLMQVHMGCYLCEEVYSERASKRRCKGDISEAKRLQL